MSTGGRLRVLISFDSARPTEELLALLPQLLGPAELELTGLYVEDEDLLRAAQLPLLREVSLKGQLSELNAERLHREQSREAATIRQAFEQLASGMRLQHRFIVTRGRATEELARVAADSDFVMVARALRASGLRTRSGAHYGALVRQPNNVLFVNEPWRSGSSVVVLQGTPQATAAARRFAAADDLRLILAVPPDEARRGTPTGGLPEGIDRRVALPAWTEEAIADLCLAEDARLLVVPRTENLDLSELLPQLMDRLPCSVLQLR
jgi:hypothetical protein